MHTLLHRLPRRSRLRAQVARLQDEMAEMSREYSQALSMVAAGVQPQQETAAPLPPRLLEVVR